MAKIQTVDYAAIPSQAKQMRSYGKDLNTQMTNAYKSIADMHSSWYGKRYNELVKQFNNMTSQINEMLQLVVTDIPSMLEKVANNYSQADQGTNVTSVSNEAPKKIQNISVSNDVGMRFITSSVQQTQSSVSTNFKNAKDKMNQIDTAYSKIKWSSEASDAFKNKFNKLKTNINKSFDDINTQFKKLMQQAQDDVQKAESSNTVS